MPMMVDQRNDDKTTGLSRRMCEQGYRRDVLARSLMSSFVHRYTPPSPVATQHSLSSRRYPLLGPDFHRLDRASLRLAHLLDHLVGAREYGRRNR
jgi:hypothetical protein